jgi:alkylation response protein AidB-like acyl-CoA dehydrogenase
MSIEPTPAQREYQMACRAFVEREIVPRAGEYDAAERFPDDLIGKMGDAGYLGAAAPAGSGGSGLDVLSFGLLCEEIGRGCASARSLVTVHNMSLAALLRWGGDQVRSTWARKLATGKAVIAFALSEPGAGSDAASLSTSAVAAGDAYVLTGRKKWVSFGRVADVFLLFARTGADVTGFLVERDRPGLRVEPIEGLSGCRASMLAEVRLADCRVPASNVVGRPGLGWQYVATSALDNGRYSVACGCVGLAEACLESSLAYAASRQQFGAPIGSQPLVQRLLADMVTNVEAARLLCYKAAALRQAGDPAGLPATNVAKYFASATASRAAADAVHIHGANGFTRAYPVERHWRDAKIMEVIEGSTEIQQMMIARAALDANRP